MLKFGLMLIITLALWISIFLHSILFRISKSFIWQLESCDLVQFWPRYSPKTHVCILFAGMRIMVEKWVCTHKIWACWVPVPTTISNIQLEGTWTKMASHQVPAVDSNPLRHPDNTLKSWYYRRIFWGFGMSLQVLQAAICILYDSLPFLGIYFIVIYNWPQT